MMMMMMMTMTTTRYSSAHSFHLFCRIRTEPTTRKLSQWINLPLQVVFCSVFALDGSTYFLFQKSGGLTLALEVFVGESQKVPPLPVAKSELDGLHFPVKGSMAIATPKKRASFLRSHDNQLPSEWRSPSILSGWCMSLIQQDSERLVKSDPKIWLKIS